MINKLRAPMSETVLPSLTAERPTSSPLPWGTWGLRTAAATYLLLFIGVPVMVIVIQGVRFGPAEFWASITRPEAFTALRLSITTAAVAALINTLMGILTAYVLVVYRFPGKAFFNTLIDLPFAIPTVVTGVMLVLLYGPQTVIGAFFQKSLGIKLIYDIPGIVLALLFVGYPFVIRTVQPVLLSMEANQTEAAQTIGASDWLTFRRVIFPAIRPAVLTGAMLSFARSLGEFGAVIVVAGNIPLKTQTATGYIYGQVEGGNIQAASSVSLVLLAVAFILTLLAERWLGGKSHA
jgi:sulfate transport system permease protein